MDLLQANVAPKVAGSDSQSFIAVPINFGWSVAPLSWLRFSDHFAHESFGQHDPVLQPYGLKYGFEDSLGIGSCPYQHIS
jgi:hypothetical protein